MLLGCGESIIYEFTNFNNGWFLNVLMFLIYSYRNLVFFLYILICTLAFTFVYIHDIKRKQKPRQKTNSNISLITIDVVYIFCFIRCERDHPVTYEV
jgi:hypothetical protein